MVYINSLLERMELDLDSLTSLIELSKGADIATHEKFITEYNVLLRIYKNSIAVLDGNEIDLVAPSK